MSYIYFKDIVVKIKNFRRGEKTASPTTVYERSCLTARNRETATPLPIGKRKILRQLPEDQVTGF